MDDLTLVASETVAFDVLGAKYVRDVEPGEICRLTKILRVIKFLMKKNLEGHTVCLNMFILHVLTVF